MLFKNFPLFCVTICDTFKWILWQLICKFAEADGKILPSSVSSHHFTGYTRIAFSPTRIYPHKDRIENYVLIQEYTGQKKVTFWYMFHGVFVIFVLIYN